MSKKSRYESDNSKKSQDKSRKKMFSNWISLPAASFWFKAFFPSVCYTRFVHYTRYFNLNPISKIIPKRNFSQSRSQKHMIAKQQNSLKIKYH